MAKLKAARSILYLNRVYEAGEELPYYDAATVEAWVECKSAFWEVEESDRAEPAKPANSTPGGSAETKTKQASRSAPSKKRKAAGR